MRTPQTALLDVPEDPGSPPAWWRRPPVLVAALGFFTFCVVVLIRASAMLEPDDYAYRASIVALSQGHLLLTTAQYHALNARLATTGGQGIQQWHHLASGKWISEKNPGYPFFAILFYALGLLRLTPLVYGAFAAVGLYLGAKAWLGKWGGAYAVLAFCFSGAALTFAWRATMPSFTDASLIAGGFGLLLWSALSPERTPRRRFLVGLLAFLALEGAVFIRYTNIIELAVAVLAVLLLRKAAHFAWRHVGAWLVSVLLFGIGVLAWNQWAYGHATATGYSAGEITFSLSSLWPNLRGMPKQLTTSMPLWILAAVALGWIVWRFGRRTHGSDPASARRDFGVGLVLATGWLGLWFLYLNYTWTATMIAGGSGHGGPGGGGVTVHVIRFYVPALGLIALLAAWLLVQLRPVLRWPIIGVLVVSALFSFQSMAGTNGVGPGTGPGGTPNIGPTPLGATSSKPPVGTGTPPNGGFGAPPKGGQPGGNVPPGRPNGKGPDGNGPGTITTSPATKLK